MPDIIDMPIENEMQSDYIDYAMSVIISRALPDARDGLKPVQRRILYSMHAMGNTHSHPTKKSARIVGDVMGKYHPHGDTAIYDTLTRMAQTFTMNHALVEGQGNMGSIDGDPPAAQRYTEVRLQTMAEDMLVDLDKEAVPFVPNFDNTETEPEILPAKIPNLLLNGASGIAVAVATSIMPHNLRELCNAILAYIENPEIGNAELIKHIQGPDFPTGGVIFNSESLISSYLTGRGSVTIRGVTEMEENGHRNRIVITEIPYTVNKATMVEQIALLAKEKKLPEISGVKDESSKGDIRVTIDLKQDANTEYVLNMLYKHTSLQLTLPIANIAVIGKRLVTLNLKQYIKIFVEHRIEVVKARTRYELRVATDRLHIVDGLVIAVNDIDNTISIIKGSADTKEAKGRLMEEYSLSDKQATAILDMKLSKLTNLETTSLAAEQTELKDQIGRYNQILGNDAEVYRIIAEETSEVRDKYSRERRTKVIGDLSGIEITRENLVVDEEVSVILTSNGYLKRLPADTYKEQDRGGRGVIAIQPKEGDRVKQVLYCMSKDYLLMLTNKGSAYWLKAYLVPEEGRYTAGKAAVNMVKLEEGEKIEKIVNTRTFEGKFIAFATQKGIVKRVSATAFSRPRSTGIRAINVDEGDSLVDVCLSDGKSELFIATRNGKAIRFDENRVRSMGRNAYGVRGIKLAGDDRITNMIEVKPGDKIASITENGFGKVTEADKYRLQGRGGAGVLNIKITPKTGNVVKSLKVSEDGSVILISSEGIAIRFSAADIRETGRSASGVRLMRLSGGAKVVDAQEMLGQQDGGNSGPVQQQAA